MLVRQIDESTLILKYLVTQNVKCKVFNSLPESFLGSCAILLIKGRMFVRQVARIPTAGSTHVQTGVLTIATNVLLARESSRTGKLN